MNSRAARILIPLAVELAFALIVFAAILATDGDFYGLGAKGVLERVAARYDNCRTYIGVSREVAGAYPRQEPRIGPTDWCMRTYLLILKRPDKAAGYLKPFGRRVFYIKHGDREEFELEGIGGPYKLDMRFRVHLPPPWLGARAHSAAYFGRAFGVIVPRCQYVELARHKGPDGRLYHVITGYRRDGETHVWIDPGDYHIHAVVRPGSNDSMDCPVTELCEGVTFDEPVDDALFDLDGEGFERLKEWIAEREKAHTN